jgi:single-strand DNA-binding protein
VVANFNIATSESYNNRNGERVTQTEWHRIELWDGLAKVAEQYLKKGNTVYIEGKLKTENWQDSDGNNRTTTRIRGLNMTMLGGRAAPPENQQQETPDRNEPEDKGPYNAPEGPDSEEQLDDLPF